MPVVMRFSWGKVRIVVHTNDHVPPHVHVEAPDAEAKLRIADLAIMEYEGFERATLKRIVAELREHQEVLQEAWDEFHEEH